jgi:hypothetical protein
MLFSAHQPAYLPWLGYFHKLALADKFVVLDDVQFEKNSFTNRNQIKSSNGPIWLTVPLLNIGHTEKTVKDMKINNDVDWRKNHWRSIYFNYKKAPFFSQHADYFENFYQKRWNNLIDVINEQLKYFISQLGIKTEVVLQSELSVNSKKKQLVVDLCRKCDANNFIFGSMGRDYADEDFFRDNDIKIYFQNYEHPIYGQQFKDFVSNMAVIDLLFNVPREDILEIIMNKNISKEELNKIFKEKK